MDGFASHYQFRTGRLRRYVSRLFIACFEEAKKKARQDRYYSCIADLRNHKIKHKGIEGIR